MAEPTQQGTRDSGPAEQSVHLGIPDSRGNTPTPWAWVPSVNFAQGLQYMAVTTLTAIIFKTMGVPNDVNAFWTSLLAFPWTIKPLWGPLVDNYGSKRSWTIGMQALIGLSFLGTVLTLQLTGTIGTLPAFFVLTIGILTLAAFASASHDIACDGFYTLALSERQQAFFVGVRSTCFRIAMVTATGLLPFVADFVLQMTGQDPTSVIVRTAPADAAIEDAPEASFVPDTSGQHLVVRPAIVDLRPGAEGHVLVGLAQAPKEGEVITARLRFSSGDSSISSANGDRIVLDASTWETGTTVTLKVDSKVNKPTSAEFKVTAGSFPLAWATVFAVLAGAYLIFVLLHSAMMPRPVSDYPQLENRPPFYIPLFYLVVTIGLPFALIYGGFIVLGKVSPQVKERFTTKEVVSLLERQAKAKELAASKDPAEQARAKAFELTPEESKTLKRFDKGFDFFYAVGRWVLLGGVVWLLLIVPAIRDLLGNIFREMSARSGIGFADVFSSFFAKEKMFIILGFLLTFRLGEAQLNTVSNFFLLGTREEGALALSTGDFGLIKGTLYIVALLLGGILGGLTISKLGLRRAIWPMVAATHLPNLLYVYMAIMKPTSLWIIGGCVCIESFGYGFGFTSYLLFMILVAQGPYKTAHYALCTGFMALGVMIPGLWSGFLQELTGYTTFFLLVMVFCVPGVLFVPFLPIPDDFGKASKPA